MKNLIKQLTELRNKTNELREKIEAFNDGYIYKLSIHCYGSYDEVEYNNSFSAKEHMDHYYGDNGIVTLETNNKEFAKEVEGHDCLNGHPIVIIKSN